MSFADLLSADLLSDSAEDAESWAVLTERRGLVTSLRPRPFFTTPPPSEPSVLTVEHLLALKDDLDRPPRPSVFVAPRDYPRVSVAETLGVEVIRHAHVPEGTAYIADPSSIPEFPRDRS